MSFAGFDRLEYPGDQSMIDLIGNTNLRWCGFYLAPAPNRPSSTWAGKRANLAAVGWGFAPIYVGQQQIDSGKPTLSSVLTSAQGAIDGGAAANLAMNEGFSSGSVIYLDIETGGPVQQETFEYAGAWQTQVTTAGFRAGIYCSYVVLDALRQNAVVRTLFFWIFQLRDQGSQNGTYSSPFPTPDLAVTGVGAASVWQYAQGQFGTTICWSNGTLDNIDLDVSDFPDPSSPV